MTSEDDIKLANVLATYGIQTNEATIPVSDVPPECDEFFTAFRSLYDFPVYIPEEENDEILIRGRWLERGGAAFIVSTAGTGKSIMSVQLSMMWSNGMEFAGLRPRKPLKVWIIQSEDSPTRVTIDREDVTAELAERFPDVDWKDVQKRVQFVKPPTCVGSEFLSWLDDLLERAENHGVEPDVIIINPFLAFIGGPITDGQYVTPFLRGGEINRVRTIGLQAILEKHRVGALIFHHTPKPPSEKEVDGWLKSPFPEYQGAGSSDITNWGRSFVTMMKVPGHPRMVQLTAGKNGSELGWDDASGARRKFLHWSDGTGIEGGARHAWREATELEIAEATSNGKPTKDDELDKAVDHIVGKVQGKAMTVYDVKKDWKEAGVCARSFEAALKKVKENPSRYNLAVERVQDGRKGWDIIGDPVEVAHLAAQIRGRYGRENDRITPHHTASRDAVDRITQRGLKYIYTSPLRDTVVTGSENGDRITALGGAVELNEEPMF